MDRLSLFVRSLFVSGSWNYRDLLSVGLSWALLPVTPGDRAIATESEDTAGGGHFNAHPYLVPLAVGVLARAIGDGADARLVQRLKDALRAPLGSLGDQLIWGAWRPLCLVSATIAVLLGAPAGLALAGLLVAYNAVNLALRWWGMNAGLSAGLDVAVVLRDIDLPSRTERVKAVGVLVFGGLVGIALARSAMVDMGLGAPALVVGMLMIGVLWGGILRRWVPLLVLLAAAFGLVGPVNPGGVG